MNILCTVALSICISASSAGFSAMSGMSKLTSGLTVITQPTNNGINALSSGTSAGMRAITPNFNHRSK